MQANNNKIRFVWDNIISKLKKTNCSIVLCPESQKPIDVNPHDLDLFDPDSKHKVITRRTIKCIISVLSDTKYITIERSLMQSNNSGQESANFKQQQQQHQHHVSPMQPMQPSNNKFALARVSMESIAAFDEMSRWIAPHHQQSTQSKALLRQNPTLVSLDSTSSQINQRTCVTNVSNVPKALSNPMLPSQQGAFLRMMQLQNFKIQKSIYETSKRQEAIQASKMQKEAENAQMQQVRMVLDQKLSETYKMQKEAENAQMQQVRMVVEQRLRETNKIQKAIENVKLQKEAENAQMQQIRMVLEQRSRETNKIQKAIENVKLQNASLMMERKKQLELVQQYVKNSAAKSPNPEVRPKVALPKPPVTCSKGPDEPEVRPVQKVVAYSNDRDWEEELYGTETNVDNDDIVI